MPAHAVRHRLLIAALAGIGTTISGGAVWWALAQDPQGMAGAEPPPSHSAGLPATVSEKELLRRAEQRLIRQCMQRNGFAYTEQPPPSPATRQFPYVIDDLVWAREHGFGNSSAGADTSERDANHANVQGLTPQQRQARQQALTGSGRGLTAIIPDLGRVSAPDNGCTAEARRSLYRDLAGWYQARRVVDHLDVYVSNQVVNDSRYHSALAAWSVCVRDHGYRADTPHELRALLAVQASDQPDGQTHAAEITAAATEAGCASSTPLSQTIRLLEQTYRPQTERRFAHERETLESFEQRAVPRARQILATS
ncbi:hypothetical protein ACQEVZ_02005 [Dactylosporangium sp. CA-152071]|uniref:hypothetical protein n=1 Tax=Dactylosporangium sp. CA-152071 TaxID=3239933 RepID=UPI003D89B7D4